MATHSCVICGCMFAGKTSHLINIYQKIVAAGKSVYVVKHNIDIRYSVNSIISHTGVSILANPYSNLKDIPRTLYSSVEWIFIDEAQFFPDLMEFVNILKDLGIKYVIAGLDFDCMRQPFGHTLQVASVTQCVLRLCAKCECGTDAVYTKKKCKVSSNSVVEVGGNDLYTPVCVNCYSSA